MRVFEGARAICRGKDGVRPASIGKKLTAQRRLEAAALQRQASAEDTHQQPPASFIVKKDFLSVLLTTGARSTRNGNLTILDTLAANRNAVQYIKALTWTVRRRQQLGRPDIERKCEVIMAKKGSEVKEVRANRFILEDENGKTRAELSMEEDGPCLHLLGENGNVCLGLTVGKDGPCLMLRDENGSAYLSVLKEGTTLWLSDKNGKSRAGFAVLEEWTGLGLCDENGNKRAGLSVDKDGPDLHLFDRNSRPIWRAP